MSLKANKNPNPNNADRVEQPVIDAGTYPARVVQLIDLGLQPQRAYQGQEKPPANELMITYELVDTFMVDKDGKELEDKPRWQSEVLPLYSIDQDKAKSTKRYFALDPTGVDGGDFSMQINKPCNVTLIQNPKGEKVYINVAGISAMRDRDAKKCPELVNPPKVFDLDEPDMVVFGSLPEWIQEKIKSNLRFKGSLLEKLIRGEVPAAKEEDPESEEDGAPENGAPW